MVISERDSDIRGAFAKFRQSFAQLFVIVGNRDAAFRAIIQDLEVQAAGVTQEFGVSSVLRDALFGGSRITKQVATGKRHELQLMLGEEITHCGGAAKLRDAIGTQLYAAKTDGRDVFNGLAILAAPGDRRIAEVNLGGRGRQWRVEMREVHGRIKQVAREKRAGGKGRGCRQGCHRAKKVASRNAMDHEYFLSSSH